MLILASKSPRRKEILSYFSIPFKIHGSDFDEATISKALPAKEYASLISLKKAEDISKIYKDDPVLGCDTIVSLNNKIFTKPQDEKDAKKILSELSNSWHSVYTALTLIFNNQKHTVIEETKILFHPLSEDQIKKYHKSFYFSDKAAGYAIQKSGSVIIKNMQGCYYNVMGLPINALKDILLKAGIDLWDYLKSF
ncbi:MAG: septum formation protein Maf [Parachlamydiales bacterium]|nr:septum formation protein Maf [Parachlamydiales bacterium]